MKTVKVIFKEPLTYGNRDYKEGETDLNFPDYAFNNLKRAGIQIEEVKEEIKEKKNVKDV